MVDGALEVRRREVIGAQRELHAEELAIVRVLDERGRIDPTIGFARRVGAGRCATRWRRRGRWSRCRRSRRWRWRAASPMSSCRRWCSWPTRSRIGSGRRGRRTWIRSSWRAWLGTRTSRRRRIRGRGFAARSSCGCGGRRGKTMLQVRGQLPDEMGAGSRETIIELTEQMKPVKGEPWAPFEQRAADALVAVVRPARAGDEHAPSVGAAPGIQVAVPLHGPAEIAGIPIADSLLEQLRANASIAPVLVDDDGVVVGDRASGAGDLGEAAAGGAAARRRAVGCPGCARRRGLQVHHLCRGVGAAPTTSPTSPRSAPHTIVCSYRTACSHWSATPTSPTVSNSSPPAVRHRSSRRDRGCAAVRTRCR